MHRLRNILETTSISESKRLLPGLFRGLFVFSLSVPLLLTASLTPRGTPISHVLQFIFYLVSLVGLVLIAGYVTYDYVGARKSGFTSLVALTGISPLKWTLVCASEMWRTFLLIWVVRLPIFAWLHTQGNLEWNHVLALEVIFLGLFGCLSSLGLLLGSAKIAKGASYAIVWFGYLIGEAICHLGFLLQAMTSYYGLQLPAGVDQFTQLLRLFSVFHHVLALMMGGFNGDQVVLQLMVLLILAVYCLWSFSQVIFGDIGANTLGIDGENATASPGKAKKMPRCWSDALAWQAVYYHQNGMKTVFGRSLTYLAIAVVITLLNYFQLSISEYGSFLFAGSGLVLSTVLVANAALAIESKEQTLPSLMMACGNPVELYQGWQRSWKYTAIPDIVFLPVLFAAIFWASPSLAYYVGAGVIGVACCGPLIFFSVFLAAWTRRNVMMSAKIFFTLLAIAGLGVLIGWAISWYLLPLVCIPLLYAFSQRILHRSLPEFFDPLIGSKND